MRPPDTRQQRLQELMDYLDREGLDVVATNWHVEQYSAHGPRDMRIELTVVSRPRQMQAPATSNAGSNYSVTFKGLPLDPTDYFRPLWRSEGRVPEGAKPAEPEGGEETFGLGQTFDEFEDWL